MLKNKLTIPEKTDLFNLSLSEIDSFLSSFGLESYRASQVKRWILKEGVSSFNQMSNLSKNYRSLLDKKAFLSRLKIHKILTSDDKTRKYIFCLDGKDFIESVLIPDKNRLTLCLSTQVGCGRGCRFCFTGKTGLKRNLEASEIINQILEVRRDIGKDLKISNLVIMGMGEPLDNFNNVMKAILAVIDKDGFDFSSRRVTLSTCGVVPGIKKLMKSGLNINLAVSLNASTDEKRDKLMPVNKIYPIKELIGVVKNYPSQRRRRVTFEYLLIKCINDDIEDAKVLAKILKGVKAKINLLNFNSFRSSEYSPSPHEKVLEFQNFLRSKNFTVNLRKSRGSDISAACGQLGGAVAAL